MKYLASVVLCLALGACSKKAEPPAPAPAPSPAPAAAPAPTAAPTPTPAAANGAVCPSCAKFTACCKAIVAKGLDDTDGKHCDRRETECGATTGPVQADFDKTCADRLASRTKDHPDVPECQ
ncbi:MAG TPA: hypothetical protein VGG74_21700 [Kofleriaceae bacterium]|jgi:hypothetical protein